MRLRLKQILSEDQGLLTFEWILLITIIVIGVVGGYSSVRDAVIDEMGDIAGAVIAVDQSFTTEAPACMPGADWGSYTDTPGTVCRQRPADPPTSQ